MDLFLYEPLALDLRFLPENRLFCSVDNTVLNAGAGGDTIATDDIGGIKHQRVKLEIGADGAASDVHAGNPLPVNIVPPTSGGCSNFHLVSAATTNANNIKASAGQLFGLVIFNNAAYPIYVKFHNTAVAPTAGIGVVKTVGVQAGLALVYANPNGIAFSTGIAITIVKGITDADATAVALSDCVVDVEYK